MTLKRNNNLITMLPAVLLSSIVLLSFLLRTYNYGVDDFSSGDSLVLPFLIAFQENSFWIFSHSYGIITPLVSIILTKTLLFFGIPVTEFFWIFPFAIMATLTIVFVYLLVKQFRGIWAALLAMMSVSLMPEYIALSRYSYGYETVSLFLAMASLYYFVSYLKNNSQLNAFILSIVLSLYVMSHAFYFFIFALFFWVKKVLSSSQDKNFCLDKKFKNVFLLKVFMLPMILAVLMMLQGVLYLNGKWENEFFKAIPVYGKYQAQTMIGHFISQTWILSRGHSLQTSKCFLDQYGWWPFLTLISLFWGIRDVSRFSKKSIFFIWGFCYLAPFFILEAFSTIRSPRAVYFCFGAVPMAVYLILVIFDDMKNFYQTHILKSCHKVLFWIIACFLSLGFIYQALGKVKIDFNPGIAIKPVGFYVKNYIGDLSIFYYIEDDEIPKGAFWVLTPDYYFRRSVEYDNANKSREQMAVDFKKNFYNIDVVITNSENAPYFDQFKKFEIKAKVFRKTNLAEEDILLIYSKKGIPLPIMDMELTEFNRRFDRQFSQEYN